jgi:SAM-dependent methyltransferase
MTTAATTDQTFDTEKLAERLFEASIGTLELASVHIGGRLGFYRSLAEEGEATPRELAARTGTDERYVREWLEQQSVAGFLYVDDPAADAGRRHYRIPGAHLPALVAEEDLSYLTPLATLTIGVLGPVEDLIEAYRSGAGVPYDSYGADTREGIGALNRPQFVNGVADWLGSVPDIDARLRTMPPARVADLACGTAWSSIAISRAYPEVSVDAIDVDEGSIETAQRNVEAVGLTERVQPRVQDASDPSLSGRYDLVTIFEALHDMNHPVEALRAAREMLAEGGSVLVADERVAERFAAPGDEIERFNYGWSVLHCLAVANLDPDSAATGTVIRPETVRRYAGAAGFGRVEELPIEHDFWRFYRLVP